MASPLIDLMVESDRRNRRADDGIFRIQEPRAPINYPEDIVVSKVKAAPRPKLRPKMGLLDHNHKPSFEPTGDSLFKEYLGVELEVEMASHKFKDRGETIYEVFHRLNKKDPEFCVVKKDGSLDCGFEICTRPAALELQREVWRGFFTNPPEGLTVSDRCGIHVHLSKAAMTNLQIGKIINFIHRPQNRKFIQLIAQRGSKKHCDFNMKGALKHSHPNYRNQFHHYSPVNLLNRDTVEIRIFAGSVDLAIILKNLEFCHALLKFTFPGVASIAESGEVSEFIKFVKSSRLFYPNLVNYLAHNGYADRFSVVTPTKIRRIL
jgi:hypothetical protein